jgi:hypothetical protein
MSPMLPNQFSDDNAASDYPADESNEGDNSDVNDNGEGHQDLLVIHRKLGHGAFELKGCPICTIFDLKHHVKITVVAICILFVQSTRSFIMGKKLTPFSPLNKFEMLTFFLFRIIDHHNEKHIRGQYAHAPHNDPNLNLFSNGSKYLDFQYVSFTTKAQIMLLM